MKTKRTKWYEPHIVPAAPGVYERKYGAGGVYLSFWDGEKWGFSQIAATSRLSKSRIKEAEIYRFPPSPKQDLPWRGIEMVAA